MSFHSQLNELYLLPFIVLGSSAGPKLLSAAGIETGLPAVQYYAEIHTSPVNALIHTLGMPFVAYGSLLIVPVLWNGTVRSYIFAQKAIYITYMSHYSSIDPKIGMAASLIYLAPTYFAVRETQSIGHDAEGDEICTPRSKANRVFSRMCVACKGALVMCAALAIQEVCGHYLCGDQASRPEGVVNAMLYAKFFSVSHWLN